MCVYCVYFLYIYEYTYFNIAKNIYLLCIYLYSYNLYNI